MNVTASSTLTTAVPSETSGAVLMLAMIPPSSNPVSLVSTSTIAAVSYFVALESSLATGINPTALIAEMLT